MATTIAIIALALGAGFQSLTVHSLIQRVARLEAALRELEHRAISWRIGRNP